MSRYLPNKLADMEYLMTTTNTICKGSTYNYAPDNKHMYIYISATTGNVCYYCNSKEAN